MKHISKFIFSITLILFGFISFAQTSVSANDSLPKKEERFGLRVGLDLFKLSKTLLEKDYKGLEVVGDYRLTKNYFIAGEIGNESKTTNDDQLNFTTKGTYFKVGFDYNAYENWLDMENVIYVGVRYGLSSFSQKLNHYSIYNTDHHFEETQTITSGEEFDGLSAHWLEGVAGVKAEVFNNLYVGFSVRLNYLLSQKTPEIFDNLYIPGFHRTYNSKFGVGFNYTISYFIPLYKSAIKTKQDKK
jgi:hypothetical protein